MNDMLKMKLEDGTLTVYLPGEVNALNAQELEKAIRGSEEYAAASRIVFDARDLHYISSLGLRLILTVKKEKDDMSIIHVDDMCYRIFDETGFTQIIAIEKALRQVEIAEMHALGSGVKGSIFKMNSEMVLKVYNGLVSTEEAKRILRTVRQAFVRGIPTMIPFEIVETEKGLGTVFEMVNAECFSDEIAGHPETVGEAAAALAELALKLASTDLTGSGVISRRDIMERMLDEAAHLFEDDELEDLRRYADAVPDRHTAVHGDLHARNIMMYNGELLLIDMDDFSMGHPVWELAAIDRIYHMALAMEPGMLRDIYCFPAEMEAGAFVAKAAGMPSELIGPMWDGFTARYFEGMPDETKEKCLALSDFYALFMMLRDVVDQCGPLREDADKVADRKRVIRAILGAMRGMDFETLKGGFDLWS